MKKTNQFAWYLLIVYVPSKQAKQIRSALAKSGAGRIGNYDACSFSSKGIGRFRPKTGAKAFIGKQNQIAKVSEERIDAVVSATDIKKVLSAVTTAHPYEEPAILVLPLLQYKDFLS